MFRQRARTTRNPAASLLTGALISFGLILFIPEQLLSTKPVVPANQPNFTLNVPDGYLRLPDSGNAMYEFATSDPDEGVPDAIVTIQTLRGEIGRTHITLPPTAAADAKLLSMQWKDFYIGLVTQTNTVGGHRFTSRTAQIPIERQAVQVVVVFPVGQEADADAALTAFVSAVDGPSSWLTPYEQGKQAGYAFWRVVAASSLILAAFRYSKVRMAAPLPTDGIDGIGTVATGKPTAVYRSFAGGPTPTGDTAATRNRRALRPAAYTSLAIFVLVGVGGTIFVLFRDGPHAEDAVERVSLLLSAAARMSFFGGLVAYGIARLLIRIRSGAFAAG